MNPRALPLLAALSLVLPALASARPADAPAATRCAVPHLRAEIGEAAWAEPSLARSACDQTPVGPPANPTIGSSWDWYLWRLAGFPVADLRSCTVRGMGDHCYVVVEDSQWNVNIDQTRVDTIVDFFENSSLGSTPNQGIWDLNTAAFGDPPDNLDQDPRVYILYYDFDVSSDGFFWSFDQQCDDVAQFHSNECDVIYMNCSDFDPAGSYLLAVLAHEFEHLIHYNYDANEAGWVDEGLAELAMWYFGDPDNISQFNTQPDRQLTVFNGNWYDYIKSYLWTLYFYERYGGTPSIRALVAEPANSIAGYDAVLDAQLYSENFDDVFSDWVVANYLDDPSIGDGRFGYVGETLPAFQPFITVSTYPIGPNASGVNHWAADYARYQSASSPTMTFDGSDTNLFAVRAMLFEPPATTQVVDMPLDALQAGLLTLPTIDPADEVVMVYASKSTAGGTAYQYGASEAQVDAPEIPTGFALQLSVAGLPTSDPRVRFALPAGAPASLDIVDVSGRRVRTLAQDLPAGAGEIVWDRRDDAGHAAAAGAYFVRLVQGDESRVAKTIVVR
ncbi:MAG: FlgD immunoglobulin-like domain containing protein [bacterium]